MKENKKKQINREVIVRYPEKAKAIAFCYPDRISVIAQCNIKDFNPQITVRQTRTKTGKQLEIKAPECIEVQVEDLEKKVIITIKTKLEIYYLYSREEVIEAVNKIDGRCVDIRGEILDIKFKSVKEDEVLVWLYTSEGLFSDKIKFPKEGEAELPELGYYVCERKEIFPKETQEQKKKRFDELQDAWFARNRKEEQLRKKREEQVLRKMK